jgi:hypothetical protein
MIGLIIRVLAFFVGVIVAILLALNITNVWNPGTLAWTAPDKAPCVEYAKGQFKDKGPPVVIDVRWIMTQQNYGWGCYYEFRDFSSATVTPIPGTR